MNSPINDLSTTKERLKRASGLMMTAEKIINGDRAVDYGDARDMHEAIAAFWTTYLNAKFKRDGGAPLTALDVAMMMDLLKTARVVNGRPKDDTFVDKIGYNALAGAFAQEDAPF